MEKGVGVLEWLEGVQAQVDAIVPVASSRLAVLGRRKTSKHQERRMRVDRVQEQTVLICHCLTGRPQTSGDQGLSFLASVHP